PLPKTYNLDPLTKISLLHLKIQQPPFLSSCPTNKHYIPSLSLLTYKHHLTFLLIPGDMKGIL
ncbi:MAG: hypothetical protein ACK53Y_20235, partial [bacterium]